MSQRTTSSGQAAAPRFDLLFESGECVAKARPPLAAGPLKIEALALSFDLPGPVDIRGGAHRLRHVRARVRHARVRVSHHALSSAAEAAGVRIRLSTEDGLLRVDARDEAGSLSAQAEVFSIGVDVGLRLVHLSWSHDAGRPAFDRLRELFLSIGVPFDATHGVFRLERPLRRALAEALLPHGWRLPDERPLGLGIELHAAGALLETEPTNPNPSPLEQARAFAEVWSGATREPLENVPTWMSTAVQGGLDGAVGRFRRAPISAKSLHAFLSDEASSWVRADTALSQLEKLESCAPFGDVIVRSLACFPADATLWRRWVERLGALGDPTSLRVIDACFAGPLPRASRAELVARGILALVDAAPELTKEDERRLLGFAARARRDAPTHGVVRGAHAAALWRNGERLEAAEAYVQAADAAEDSSERAMWRRRGAELYLGVRGPAAAMPLLEQALVESGGDPRIVLALARVAAERGDETRADELLGGLLRSNRGSAEALQDALLGAARFHVERGAPDRARPFLAAMHEAPPELLSSSPFATFRPQPAPSLESILEGEIPLVSWADAPANDRDEHDSSEPPRSEVLHADSRAVPDGTAIVQAGEREHSLEAERAGSEPERPPSEPQQLHPQPPEKSAAGSTLEPGARPDVTLVSIADGDMRALLVEARATDDPSALLEGALEEAIEEASAEGVRNVLRVLDRLESSVESEEGLRNRAMRLLTRLGEQP